MLVWAPVLLHKYLYHLILPGISIHDFLTNHHKLTSNLTSLSLSCSGGQKAEAKPLAGGAEEKPIHFPGAHGFWPPLDFLDLQYLPGSPCLTSHDTSPVSGHLCPNSLFLKTSRFLTNVHLGCYASILTWLRLETPQFSSTFTNTGAEEEKANVCFGGHNSRDSIRVGFFLAPVLPTASCFPFPHQHDILYDLLSWSLNVFWIHQGFSHLAPFHWYPPKVCSCLEQVDQGRYLLTKSF